jgi:hypothetical protein
VARGPKATIRIIDHKKIWVTPDEYRYYEEICRGYDRPNFKGEELFQDHFETNDDGVIIFVKPPHKRYSSMEVYTFLVSLQVNQQLRIVQDQVESLILEADKKFKEKLEEIEKLKGDIEQINKLREEIGEIETLQTALKNMKEGVERPKEKAVKANSKKRRKTDDGNTN